MIPPAAGGMFHLLKGLTMLASHRSSEELPCIGFVRNSAKQQDAKYRLHQ